MRSFNVLFLLGPLMRSLYEEFSRDHPDIARDIRTFNVGYPRTDNLLRRAPHRESILKELRLDPSFRTVIYAPAWDVGSSLRTYGTEVVEKLLDVPEINVIVKLHPVLLVPPNSQNYIHYTDGIDWPDRFRALEKENARLRYVEEAEVSSYFGACDAMVADFSTIALEFMLLDRPVVYIDCPGFFESHLKRYGYDPALMKSDDRFNAGRNCGVVVDGLSDLARAVKRSLDYPDELSYKRRDMTKLLLYNPGHASEVAADTVMELLGLREPRDLRK
jgi:CDP-glycerol glycerophosphotransferase (TagB/SpsB family)